MGHEPADAFDAAPFAVAMSGGTNDLHWEDVREVHRIVVRLSAPVPEDLQVQYWRTRWPQNRLPKDRVPSGGQVGWLELGNWFTGAWQTAHTEMVVDGQIATFAFRPVNETEFPNVVDYPARFRVTLRLRLVSATLGDEKLAASIEELRAYTDSVVRRRIVSVGWRDAPGAAPTFSAHNGTVESVSMPSSNRAILTVRATENSDPNSYDRTLVTVRADATTTFAIDDLDDGPLDIRHLSVTVESEHGGEGIPSAGSPPPTSTRPGVLDRVRSMPEQTWRKAWVGMPPKHESFYLPVAVEGGRHKFGVNPDGSVFYRTNHHYLTRCPGRDTPRIDSLHRLRLSFDLPKTPDHRGIVDGTLPILNTTWSMDGCRIQQEAYATVLTGTDPGDDPPEGDAFGVLMLRFALSNVSEQTMTTSLRLECSSEAHREPLTLEPDGTARVDGTLRFAISTDPEVEVTDSDGRIHISCSLEPGAARSLVVKVPYVGLDNAELGDLDRLDYDRERDAVARYWRRRLSEGMRLTTPEPMLNEFHAAHAGHLLINCEKEPGSTRRFARVGSFGYAAFGNESCMMIVDLDRRGYHREARECLDAFLAYQGTVSLPGDYDSHQGVLYGAHGYECGGYNQHHGWILWCLVEHFRFTRDDTWLNSVAPNLVAASDWIIGQRERTLTPSRIVHPLLGVGAGLLPHGSLEDIGDWWQWLSTNVYSWRGLDAAAWALEQLDHRDAGRIRQSAGAYRDSILAAFRAARDRSPVVRLRDGRAVPRIPSHVHRRGRSFGWICETLEGAIHLLIARMIEPSDPEADWILRDYEDNLYLSHHYGYEVSDYEREWFGRGGFSLQACLLFDVEPHLDRDDIHLALRAMFNAIAAYYFPDTRMLTEHALVLGEWRGDHYKSSDEANATGWLRYLFVREVGDELLLGQAIPRSWLAPGKRIGVTRAATHFGPMSLEFCADTGGITANLEAPTRNAPSAIRLRFRAPLNRRIVRVTVGGREWSDWDEAWVSLPGNIGATTIRAEYDTPSLRRYASGSQTRRLTK
ncbi:hypothetical protein FJZ36_08915 [Candidatus Poribacteria bacterium]|nr:hypothetical protein [Candidatus Poribacteria bacterium]